MLVWYEILSEFLINIGAAWLIAAVVEINIISMTQENILSLIFRSGLGILSLFAAKFLREKSRRIK